MERRARTHIDAQAHIQVDAEKTVKKTTRPSNVKKAVGTEDIYDGFGDVDAQVKEISGLVILQTRETARLRGVVRPARTSVGGNKRKKKRR